MFRSRAIYSNPGALCFNLGGKADIDLCHSTSQQTKYLQDLWIYDCHTFLWHNPVLPPGTHKPDPRSSFSLHPHDAGAVMYGGYSRVKVQTAAGKSTKGGAQATKTVLKPTIHEDTWFLRITPPELPTHGAPIVRWERRKRPANSPNPPRAGVTRMSSPSRQIPKFESYIEQPHLYSPLLLLKVIPATLFSIRKHRVTDS